MHHTVRLFAVLRDLAGQETLELELPPGARVTELRAAVLAACPALAGQLEAARVAIDLEFAPEDALLGVGQELALIPPVSGG